MEAVEAEVSKLCERLLNVQDTENSPDNVKVFEESLQTLFQLTDTLCKSSFTSHRHTVAVVTLTAAAHSGHHYWTNSNTRLIAHDLSSKLTTWSGNEQVEEFLAGTSDSPTGGVLRSILSLLKEKLTKEEWKHHPAHKQALFWCIRQLKHPNVSPFLDVFLPATLLVLDDHEDYHKALALNAITHIVRNMDPSELRWYGRAEVIYEATKPLIYNNTPEVINALQRCLLALLPVLDVPTKPSIPAKPNRTSEVFGFLLNSLQYEGKLASRKAYVSHVNNYIEALGIQCVRHMKDIINALLCCLEYQDYSGEDTRMYALQAMVTLIVNAWPRIPHHREKILKGLLQLISDLCPSNATIPDTPVVQSQLQLICKCLSLLAAASPGTKELCDSLKSSCQHKGLKYCLGQTHT